MSLLLYGTPKKFTKSSTPLILMCNRKLYNFILVQSVAFEYLKNSSISYVSVNETYPVTMLQTNIESTKLDSW